jgi:hypothetical protein
MLRGRLSVSPAIFDLPMPAERPELTRYLRSPDYSRYLH